jgi:hypothetical protein
MERWPYYFYIAGSICFLLGSLISLKLLPK